MFKVYVACFQAVPNSKQHTHNLTGKEKTGALVLKELLEADKDPSNTGDELMQQMLRKGMNLCLKRRLEA